MQVPDSREDMVCIQVQGCVSDSLYAVPWRMTLSSVDSIIAQNVGRPNDIFVGITFPSIAQTGGAVNQEWKPHSGWENRVCIRVGFFFLGVLNTLGSANGGTKYSSSSDPRARGMKPAAACSCSPRPKGNENISSRSMKISILSQWIETSRAGRGERGGGGTHEPCTQILFFARAPTFFQQSFVQLASDAATGKALVGPNPV